MGRPPAASLVYRDRRSPGLSSPLYWPLPLPPHFSAFGCVDDGPTPAPKRCNRHRTAPPERQPVASSPPQPFLWYARVGMFSRRCGRTRARASPGIARAPIPSCPEAQTARATVARRVWRLRPRPDRRPLSTRITKTSSITDGSSRGRLRHSPYRLHWNTNRKGRGSPPTSTPRARKCPRSPTNQGRRRHILPSGFYSLRSHGRLGSACWP